MDAPTNPLKYEHRPTGRRAAAPSLAPRRYRRLFRRVAFSTAGVTILPLLIMTGINYYQYHRAIGAETRHPIASHTTNTQRAVESFLKERESALRFIVRQSTVTLDCTNAQLAKNLKSLRTSLSIGSFVDLGVIDTSGRQRCYAGPYKLQGKSYQGQDWFGQVNQRGIYISDVFLGFRKSPHFVIAIRHEGAGGGAFILRATVDSRELSEQILTIGLRPSADAFLINRKGVLQSRSRNYGKVLGHCPLKVPHFSRSAQVVEQTDRKGEIYVGYAYIENSPFILMLIRRPEELMGGWISLRAELLVFLSISVILILMVIYFVSRNMVRRIREADVARAQVFHKMEYNNKLASVGRLAAGVAHEINNPLAIINEKAGLLQDRITLSDDDFPQEKKLLATIDSILKSVLRCSTITHRLLGFAKHMDIQFETIELDSLLKEVLGFLDKEATFRNIKVDFSVDDNTPSVESDRGQLQQVFLNLVNNAFAAMEDGGQLEIAIERVDDNTVAVHVKDDGMGIPEENLERIFEPFFTTKPGIGTGLGLSVTYGIVEKLGGDLRVKSEVGKGTRFIVTLPVTNPA
jgi:two-component system, NtrC family, sensor kinase